MYLLINEIHCFLFAGNGFYQKRRTAKHLFLIRFLSKSVEEYRTIILATSGNPPYTKDIPDNPSNGKNEEERLKNTEAVSYGETEKMRNESMHKINQEERDIVQDNADLRELEMRYDHLDIPDKERRIIDDYIACILSRQERMEALIYYAGRIDALGGY